MICPHDWFATIDLKAADHHTAMDPRSRKFLHGQTCYLYASTHFGLTTASRVFNRFKVVAYQSLWDCPFIPTCIIGFLLPTPLS